VRVIAEFPLPLAPSHQGREDCKQELFLHLLFGHCEARSAAAISVERLGSGLLRGVYPEHITRFFTDSSFHSEFQLRMTAAKGLQRHLPVIARSISDEAISAGAMRLPASLAMTLTAQGRNRPIDKGS